MIFKMVLYIDSVGVKHLKKIGHKTKTTPWESNVKRPEMNGKKIRQTTLPPPWRYNVQFFPSPPTPLPEGEGGDDLKIIFIENELCYPLM